jgi:hypothetical protein
MQLEDISAIELMVTSDELQPESITEDDSFELDIEEEGVAPRYREANG